MEPTPDFLKIQDSSSNDEFITALLQDINNIDTSPLINDSLRLDQWDWVVVGFSSLLASLSDLVLGRPSGFKEPKVKNDQLFGLGKKINQYEMRNNPIDFQDLRSFGGDHRLYSYGHDLLRFFEGVRQTMVGEYRGISSGGITGEVVKQFSGYESIAWEKAVLINVLHLFKDFFTTKSLPIPGMSILANLNNNKMPEFAEKLYDNGVNVRTMTAQAISITVIEISIRVFNFFKNYNKDIDSKLLEEKLQKMLLLSHSIAATFNLGKVVLTKNPFLLNTPQFILIFKYVIQLIKKQLDNYQKRIENKKYQIVRSSQYMNYSTIIVHEFSNIESIYFEFIKTNEELITKYNALYSTNLKISRNSSDQSKQFKDVVKLLSENNE